MMSQKNLRNKMPQKPAQTASNVAFRDEKGARYDIRTNACSDGDEATQVMPDQVSHWSSGAGRG